MKYISKTSIFLLLFSVLITSATAQTIIDKPAKVMDYGKLYSKHEKNLLKLLLGQFQKKTKAEMFILTVEKLDKETIDDIGIHLIDHWNKKGLAPGDKERDDGLLFIISKKDRKMRLEVGQGLEGKITDHKAGNIIRLLPEYFKKGDFYGGTAKVIEESAKIINGSTLSYPKDTSKSSQSKKEKKRSPLFVIFIILLIISSFFNNRRGGGIYISTGGFSGGFSGGGGGFSGGGGGGFSGGGASGGW